MGRVTSESRNGLDNGRTQMSTKQIMKNRRDRVAELAKMLTWATTEDILDVEAILEICDNIPRVLRGVPEYVGYK